MRIGFGLQMQQQQKLIMTPELRQAIAVLLLPVMELGQFIEQELLENPCLEVEPKEESDEAAPSLTPRRLVDYLGSGDGGGGVVTEASDDEIGFEAFTTVAPTLHEQLTAQLLLASLDGKERRVGEFLIGSIDDHGYLTITVEEAAERLGSDAARVGAVLQIIQGFDPAGVGARSLQECLQLQWAPLGDANPIVPVLIDRYLDHVGEGRLTWIATDLGVTPWAVQEAIDLIRTLNPKPGRSFGRSNETRYVVPDVVIERVGGEYVVLVNDSPVPRLMVSNHYRQLLAGEVDSDARRYVEQKITAAQWVIKAIEQRRMTVYNVTETIVRFQRGFFDQGIRKLRPLTLRAVAEVVGVHESTVSRATAGKYVQTPRGTFELKFFFSSGVDGESGEGVAAESVKRLIADLIAKEDPTGPLSDQALTGALNRQGIHISRRTVAKYREEMRVRSSAKRRRYK